MACGLPVAAFDNEVNRYIIENNKSGILGDDLENNILYASEIPKENAIERAMKFSWEKATDQFISYIV
jgi:glycosyltransferase involved in cell wall biosynthesis